jgi:hypothetical protein
MQALMMAGYIRPASHRIKLLKTLSIDRLYNRKRRLKESMQLQPRVTRVRTEDFPRVMEVWVPIGNNWGYPEGKYLLPINKDYPPGLTFTVLPDVGTLKSATTVRIVIIGQVKDRPGEQVAAFIDVRYEPSAVEG